MAVLDQYRRQVRLLMRLLPIVAQEPCFALKGGTAINLFIRDLPRLSVDIDLVYLPLQARADALAGIHAAMKRIERGALAAIPAARSTRHVSENAVVRLLIHAGGAQVKIEVSPVLRGVVRDPAVMPVTEGVEAAFGFAETNVVSFDDLYAGKLVAALDRQHPRDFFDIRGLLDAEGLTDSLRETFLVYLLSHNRPMGEVLSGRIKDLTAEYRDGFDGMTEDPVPLETLIATQHEIIDQLVCQMPDRHRSFLIGFEKGSPDWSLLAIPHAPELPAIRWRQRNLDRLSAEKRSVLVSLLERSLEQRLDQR